MEPTVVWLTSARKRKIKNFGGWCVFGVVVSLIWALFSVPNVLYFTLDLSTDGSSEESHCVQQTYTGVCREHLLKYQTCRCNDTTANGSLKEAAVCIPSSQLHQEDTAQHAILNITLLNPSPECEVELAEFICLSLFGVCTDSGEVVRPSSNQCERLRTDICAREWETAVDYEQSSMDDQYNFESILINCSTLPNTANQTTAYITNCSEARTECSSGFYSDGGLCVPECGEWKEHSETTTVVMDTMVILGACTFILGAIIVLIVSCRQQYRNMYSFPSILFLHGMFIIGVYQMLLLISYIDRKKLYCSHRNYTETLGDPTSFCYIMGGMSVLEGQLATSLWLCHVMVVLWGIAFPFHARRTLDNPKQRRCLHITILFLSTITSLAILAATVASGDFITQFPPTHCVLTNANAAYSLQLLPASIKCAVAASSMTLTFWLLIINRHKRKKVVIKILLFLLYFMFTSLCLTVTLAVSLYESRHYKRELEKYFECEATGMESCSKSKLERLDNAVLMNATSWMLVAAYPFAILVYMIGGVESWLQLLRSVTRSIMGHNSQQEQCGGSMHKESELRTKDISLTKENGMKADVDPAH